MRRKPVQETTSRKNCSLDGLVNPEPPTAWIPNAQETRREQLKGRNGGLLVQRVGVKHPWKLWKLRPRHLVPS